MGKLKAALARMSFYALALGACAAAPTPAPTALEVTLVPSLSGELQPVSAPERGGEGRSRLSCHLFLCRASKCCTISLPPPARRNLDFW